MTSISLFSVFCFSARLQAQRAALSALRLFLVHTCVVALYQWGSAAPLGVYTMHLCLPLTELHTSSVLRRRAALLL